jgi:hypothetical protein
VWLDRTKAAVDVECAAARTAEVALEVLLCFLGLRIRCLCQAQSTKTAAACALAATMLPSKPGFSGVGGRKSSLAPANGAATWAKL